MKKLLNTLYVLTPDAYLFCRNENICIQIQGEEKLAVPAITIDSIVCFGKMTVSTPLLEFCGERGISVAFVSPQGHFMGRFYGPVSGNVLLRKRQYESINQEAFCNAFVKSLLLAKLRNSKLVLMRSARLCKSESGRKALNEGAEHLSSIAKELLDCEAVDTMRGMEGAAANVYFAHFDQMIAGNSGGFRFETRSRRPPRNEVNAVLSFTYMLLTREIQSALETVGLDPSAGYLHTLRPGRPSLALDMIEELRAPLCDRFVMSLFNRGQLSDKDFEKGEEAVLLNDRGRRTLLSSWQKRKQEEITHPFFGRENSYRDDSLCPSNAACQSVAWRSGCVSALCLEVRRMMLVVAYDVDTTTPEGAKRLRKVAKLCERYGMRVQNSVFEVLVDPAQLAQLKAGIQKVIQSETDSVRFYRLGSNYKPKIEVIGRTSPIEAGEPLLI